MSNYKEQWLTTLRLIERDFFVMSRTRLLDGIINNFIIILCLYAIFAWFGYFVGVVPSKLGMIFCGIMVGNIVYIGFNQAIGDVFDLDTNRFMNYQVTLPIRTNWFIARLYVRYVMELLFVSLPALVLTKLLLGSLVPLHGIRWGWFMVMYFSTLLFTTTLFLMVTFSATSSWFRFNIWQRILWPMNALGCAFYSWQAVVDINPSVAYLLLFNPQTYLNEGIRAAILPGELISLPPGTCSLVIVSVTLLGIIRVRKAMRHKLQNVG